METLLRHESGAQKEHYLPQIAEGKLRLQSMGVTEPTTGSDTTKICTTAVRQGDKYVGSELIILLAQTTPLKKVKRKSEGMPIFLVDRRNAIGNGLTVKPIAIREAANACLQFHGGYGFATE